MEDQWDVGRASRMGRTRGWEGPEDRKSRGDESVFGGRWSSCVGRDPKKWEYHGGWMGLVGWK
jgi:hypothetical protein